jgi:hypothetical protein
MTPPTARDVTSESREGTSPHSSGAHQVRRPLHACLNGTGTSLQGCSAGGAQAVPSSHTWVARREPPKRLHEDVSEGDTVVVPLRTR